MGGQGLRRLASVPASRPSDEVVVVKAVETVTDWAALVLVRSEASPSPSLTRGRPSR